MKSYLFFLLCFPLLAFSQVPVLEPAWKDNSRVKRALLLVDGEPLAEIRLQDSYKGQRFSLGSFPGKSILTLRIVEVYPGDKYADTAISEINFDGTGDH